MLAAISKGNSGWVTGGNSMVLAHTKMICWLHCCARAPVVTCEACTVMMVGCKQICIALDTALSMVYDFLGMKGATGQGHWSCTVANDSHNGRAIGLLLYGT